MARGILARTCRRFSRYCVIEVEQRTTLFGGRVRRRYRGRREKAGPRLIEAVLDALGARPAEAVMVGDAANDVAAARAAGIPVILRAGGYTPVPANELGADRIIIDFLELPEAMLAVSAVDAGARCESAGSTARMPRHAQTAPERLQGSRLDKRARRQ